MPLHDWKNPAGWEVVHHLWLGYLYNQVRQRLPSGYKAYIGSGPGMAVGSPPLRPGVSVRRRKRGGRPAAARAAAAAVTLEPDEEVVAVADADPTATLYVSKDRQLVAAVEIVSPRNKDRPAARERYARRYASYLLDGCHLMLVDLLPRPQRFSFAEQVEAEVGVPGPVRMPTPFAAAYRAGEPVGGEGRLVAIWRRPLAVGRRLPTLPLPLSVHESIPVDLEAGYAVAAADAELE